MTFNYISPIKLLISEKTYNEIVDDAKRFQILKLNGEPSINKFVNIVIQNYLEEYANQEMKKIHNIEKELIHIKNEFEKNDVATKIYESILYMGFNKDETLGNKYISLKPNQESNLILEHIKINVLTSSITLTTYLRNMLSSFFKLPTFEREIIIFKNEYDTIKNAIKDNINLIIITKEKSTIRLKPICIDTTNEEIHNYIIGKEAANKSDHFIIAPRKLRSIKNIYPDRKTKIDLTEQDLVLINKMKRNGIQFNYKSDEENIIVEFTKKGFDLYNKTFLQKPNPIHPMEIINEKYILEFDCSYFQLQNFLYKFGKEAKVIKPKKLAKKIQEFHYQAYSIYNKEESK